MVVCLRHFVFIIQVNMGNIYFKLGQYAKAIKFYRMALDQVTRIFYYCVTQCTDVYMHHTIINWPTLTIPILFSGTKHSQEHENKNHAQHWHLVCKNGSVFWCLYEFWMDHVWTTRLQNRTSSYSLLLLISR